MSSLATGTASRARRSERGLLARKLVHGVLSLAAAALVWQLPYPAGAAVLAGATAVALAVELARRAHTGFAHRFRAVVGVMLREREAARLTGATTLAMSFTVTAALFPGWPAVAAILVAGLADPAAALVGRRSGRHRYAGGKSVEGSLAFLVAAVAVLVAVPPLGVTGALAVGLVLTAVEAPTLPVDDNLYLPLVAAAAVAVASGAPLLGGFS
jgi:dolichol kinase